ncbi:hypothetical protein LFAB_14740 [Lactiplantibacillus fabifermentans T30PCM01]|uniref:Chloride channel protein n=1 Tax=Lactiplantibacillus fabifermentans T30PCM01 TaxID=1400520 RepID=W6T5I5_9LACO|nr:chloride channel protein [Lactiplantibacillus fabifermentans]ETY73063.1 hypothetical protein LFAB_14740 [Lactiplantibacillus fabifermentans T30PCM01]
MVKHSKLLLLCLLFSSGIGLLMSSFLILTTKFSLAFSQQFTWWQQLLALGLGTLILMSCHQLDAQLPWSPATIITKWRQGQPLTLKHLGLNLLVAGLILSLGAGVAPGATVVSATITLSIWMAAKLRYFYFNYATLQQLPWHQRRLRLVNPQHYLWSFAKRPTTTFPQQWERRGLIGLGWLAGVSGFLWAQHQADLPNLLTSFGQSYWSWPQLWLIIPIIIGGYGLRELRHHWSLRPVTVTTTTLIGGALLIFSVARFAPHLLFSGQFGLPYLVQHGAQLTTTTLVSAALLKLLFLAACRYLGWGGGDLLPLVVSGACLGLALAQLCPNLDPLLLIAIISTSLAGALTDHPLLAGVGVSLFCPFNLWPVIGLTIAGLLGVKHVLKSNAN